MNIIGMLRRVIPSQYKDTFVSLATRLTPVKARAGYTNIYHCCVYRTGSQWIRRIFSDPRVYCWSGLKPINGASLGGNAMNRIPVIDRAKPEGFPPKTAVIGMYLRQFPENEETRKLFSLFCYSRSKGTCRIMVSFHPLYACQKPRCRVSAKAYGGHDR